MSKIIGHTSNGFKWLLVEVPETQRYFDLYGTTEQLSVKYNTMPKPRQFKPVEIPLPSGSWEIVGKADSMTEEQWKEIVEIVRYKESDKLYISSSFKRYDKIPNAGAAGAYRFAKDSGFSLLRSHGLNISETLILKSTAI